MVNPGKNASPTYSLSAAKTNQFIRISHRRGGTPSHIIQGMGLGGWGDMRIRAWARSGNMLSDPGNVLIHPALNEVPAFFADISICIKEAKFGLNECLWLR